MKSSFDDYKDSFMDSVNKSISFSGKDAEFFTKVKVYYLLKIIEKQGQDIDTLKVLDVGCGIGRTDYYLKNRFQELHGIDVSQPLIQKAKKNNPSVFYQSYDGLVFPYTNDKFDVAFAICVLHHIPQEQWDNIILQMKRVIKPNGLVVIFEHNPFNPLTLLAVNRCDFDKDASLLSGNTTKRLLNAAGLREVCEKYILLSPYFRFLQFEMLFSSLPFGAQYYVSAKKLAGL